MKSLETELKASEDSKKDIESKVSETFKQDQDQVSLIGQQQKTILGLELEVRELHEKCQRAQHDHQSISASSLARTQEYERIRSLLQQDVATLHADLSQANESIQILKGKLFKLVDIFIKVIKCCCHNHCVIYTRCDLTSMFLFADSCLKLSESILMSLFT